MREQAKYKLMQFNWITFVCMYWVYGKDNKRQVPRARGQLLIFCLICFILFWVIQCTFFALTNIRQKS